MIIAILNSLFWSVICMFGVRIFMKVTSGKCTSTKRLDGMTAIVTGANSGIGLETAKDLARRGARVILACRNFVKATAAKKEIIEATGSNNVICMELDTSSLASVREFAEKVKNDEPKIHILVNNAGAIGPDQCVLTEDGLETQMQTNYFGPFLLTYLLLDILKDSAPSRIVNVSSDSHLDGKIEFDNLNSEKDGDEFGKWKVYGKTKLANILHVVELARQLEGTGVTANACHPGFVHTNFFQNMLLKSLINWTVQFMFKSAEEGAQTSIYLAVSDDVKDVSGEYFADCGQVYWMRSKITKDKDIAKKLWEASEKLVGLS